MADSSNSNSGSQKRSICKRFYVNAAEEKIIELRCQGVNQSRFFRSRVLGQQIPRPKVIIPQVNRDIYVELVGIGQKLDHIAKRLASTTPLGDRDQIEQLADLKKLLIDVQLQLSQADQAGGEDDWEADEE